MPSASCTLFSPKTACPAAKASRTRSAGFVLLTATRVTSRSERPARAAARAIRFARHGRREAGSSRFMRSECHFLRAAISPLAVATFWAFCGLSERYFSRWAMHSAVLPWPTAIVPR